MAMSNHPSEAFDSQAPKAELISTPEGHVDMVMGLHPEADLSELSAALREATHGDSALYVKCLGILVERDRQAQDEYEASMHVDTGRIMRALTGQSGQMRERLTRVVGRLPENVGEEEVA